MSFLNELIFHVLQPEIASSDSVESVHSGKKIMTSHSPVTLSRHEFFSFYYFDAFMVQMSMKLCVCQASTTEEEYHEWSKFFLGGR